MGKNRKPRNVDQGQLQNGFLETGNQNQEIPEDFLTSDDFCVVQKKKGSKKSPDNEAFVPRSRSNSGKKLSKDEGGKCHMSFWTCKSNGTTNGCSTSNGSVSQSDDVLEDVLNCPFYSSSVESHNSIDLDLNSVETKEATVQKKINLSISAENSENVPINNIKSEELFNDLSDLEQSSENELPLTEAITENAHCTKKPNKKKDLKKKSIDEEVERLLKELEPENQKCLISSSSADIIISTSDISPDKITQCLKSKDIADNCESIDLPNGTLNDCVKFELQNGIFDDVCNVSSDLKTMKCSSSGEIHGTGSEAVSMNTETKPSSQKRKEKKAKAKLKKSNGCVENSEINAKDSLNCGKDRNFLSSTEEKRKDKSVGGLDKRNKKRPNKKQLAIIHEALRKAKEEEDRLLKEEEAKQKMAEEAERIRLEKLRLEQEKKDKKKLKEKQRREKMKAEGRLLSKSQKQSRARMEATLAALREQGIDVPQICDKKPTVPHGPRLGNCKNFHRKRLDSCQSTQSIDSAIVVSERQKFESFSSQESSGKDSLSDFPSSLDLTEDLCLTPEFDKANFSFSEESDDNFISSKSEKKESESKILIEKSSVKTVQLSLTASSEPKSEASSVRLRSPVVCVLGHVDTGKTKILDFIRKTHVQDSEAGGITQQIGATMIPHDALKEKCKMVKDFSSFDLKIPGLLVIDTPGHESFGNLRSRGSSICDIAVLVVDIMHGLEPQTIESINLLKKGKTPFIVALNKVDRIYGWKSFKDEDIETTIMNQSQTTRAELKKLCQEIILQFANQCLNVALFYENNDPRSYVSMVPTSAISGDGMGNILGVVAQLTQSLMPKKLIYSEELEAIVLEVKAIPGLGTTIDVILVNGRLQEGDTIVLAGQEGPIVTQIRSLLMPQSLKELRVKNPYIEYKNVEGAQGVKVTGKDLEKSVAGLPLLIAPNHNMIDLQKAEINALFHDAMNSIRTSERGVYVQASTLGSLEALLEFLNSSGIPYFNVKIGPVVKKDVMKASIMLEHDVMYAAILAFDVKIERDAQELADSVGVQIFHADIIYHLFDMYVKYKEDLLLKRQEEVKRHAVFPCKLKILPEFVFSVKDPIVLGVHIEAGTLKEGTPLCVPSRDIIEVGIVSSIEVNNSKISCAKNGQDVCITISSKPGDSPKMYGKHFSHEELLVSRINRQSIDTCKEHYRSELQSSDWHLMVELKKMLHIM